MRLTGFLALLACGSLTLAQERLLREPAGAPGPLPATPTRIPLQYIETFDEYWHFDQADRPPLLVVGRLAAPQGDFRRYTVADPHGLFAPYPAHAGSVIPPYLRGDAKPRAPREDAPALAFLRGPMLDRGQDWGPDSIAIQGNVITITVTAWLDDRPRWKNVPFMRNYVLSLGYLKAGEYELRLVDRGMMEHDGTIGFRLESLRQGKVRFDVEPATAPDVWDAPMSRAVLAEKDLAAAEISQAGRDLNWQKPNFAYREWGVTSALDYTPPGVACGGVAMDEWLKTDLAGSIPAVAPVEPGHAVYARLVGSLLYRGEWAEVREITWSGADVTIHADVWCSVAADRENWIHRPALVVPLSMAAPGGSVRVEWHVLSDEQTRGRFVETERSGEPSPRRDEFMHDLTGHSEAPVFSAPK